MGGRWNQGPRDQDDRSDDGQNDWERDAGNEDDEGDDGWGASSWSQQRSQQRRRPQPPAYPQRSYPGPNPGSYPGSYQRSGAYQRSYPASGAQPRSPSSNWNAAPARAAGGRQPQRKKGSALPVVAVLLVLLAAAAAAGYVERGRLKALLKPAPSATAGPSLVAPAFSDWRVAYLGQDGHLHAVSLDGKTDATGTSLSSLPAATSGTPAATSTTAASSTYASASPDGQYLLYADANGPILLHLTAHTGDQDAARAVPTGLSTLVWSPDSAHLAGFASDGAVHLLTIATLADTPVPSTSGKGIQAIVGWIDGSHLAIRVAKSGATSDLITALDVASGQQRTIVSLYKPGYGSIHYSLSSDGAHLFVWNTAVNGQPFTAIFRNYDTKTGDVRKLPVSLKATGTTVSAAAWKPGTQLIALTSGAAQSGKLWLIDAANDTATAIGASGYALSWVSDGSALIVGSALSATPGGGPYTISAVTFPSSGTPAPVDLTDKAMAFPWLGLVKTA